MAVEKRKEEAYWKASRLISEYILENKRRANYSSKVIEDPSRDLNTDKPTLTRMVKFYRLFPIVATWQQLEWSHYRLLNDRSITPMCTDSCLVVGIQISADFYLRLSVRLICDCLCL
ncbi:MAG: hypothetical protein ISS45_09690 [Candidatus Omnitrophica bacterium]|nr:hypothetical protein [Candidatus Omnitrophota bacterium]